jgi:hypothetical protein
MGAIIFITMDTTAIIAKLITIVVITITNQIAAAPTVAGMVMTAVRRVTSVYYVTMTRTTITMTMTIMMKILSLVLTTTTI